MEKLNKYIYFICLVMFTNLVFSQGKWIDFSKEKIISKTIKKSTKFKINDLVFDAVWNKKLIPNENLGYLGGIKKLSIFHNKKIIDNHIDIIDNIGLQYVIINFYDYNFDGFIDFSIQDDCGSNCSEKYYLYDKALKKFIHKKEWNLRIQKINKTKKLILTQPDGMKDNRTLYEVHGSKLIEVKRNEN